MKSCPFIILIITVLIACSPTKKEANVGANELVKEFYVQGVLDLQKHLNEFRDIIENDSEVKIQRAYLNLKEEYKRIEFLTEEYFPSEAKGINGAPLPEVDYLDDRNFPPSGFQVIEELVFPLSANKEEIHHEIEMLDTQLRRVLVYMENKELRLTDIFDAARNELFRIITLGISGYDSPITQNSIPEAISSLEGLKEVLNFFKNQDLEMENKLVDSYQDELNAAINYLRENNSFNDFDRLFFTRNHINPLTEDILTLQENLNIPFDNYTLPINPKTKTLFTKEAFTSEAFAPRSNRNSSPKMIALGKTLFFDPVLSGNNKRSCATCHNPNLAFADSFDKSPDIDNQSKIHRNTPTMINAGLQKAMFYDLRMIHLEDQIPDVLSNEKELHTSLDEVALELNQSKEYQSLFEQVFNNDSISGRMVKNALGSYVRSLSSLDSRFDEYMRGDDEQMTLIEKKGFNIFMGKAKCGTCHFMPLFNGTIPPYYKVTESEVIGVPSLPDTANATIDSDLGRFNKTRQDIHKHAFKTVTVRNAALTPPYMHNGVYQTLEEVIDFYNRGGGAGIGIDLEHQTLPPDPLNLTDYEQESIVAFIHTLTDTTGLTSIPKQLPKFDGKEGLKRQENWWGLLKEN